MKHANESSVAKWITDGLDSSRMIVLRDVPNVTGFGTERRCDLIVVDTWPSGGGLRGYEIKCSRADWLNELKNPTKSDTFSSLCDEWCLAISDPRIIRPGELPEGWGLVAASGPNKVRTLKRPHHRKPRLSKLPYGFVLALLRRASARTIELEKSIGERVRERLAEDLKEERTRIRNTASRELERLKLSVKAFENRSGVEIADYNGESLGELVKLARLMNPKGFNSIPGTLDVVVANLRRQADAVERDAASMRGALNSKSH